MRTQGRLWQRTNRGVSLFLAVLLCFGLQAQSYFANGDAKALGNQCYQLTPASTFKNGSVWYADKIDLEKDFDLEFYLNFGSLDASGADGIVFVLQNRGNKALGNAGGGLGFEGFTPSLGIEFDDYQNTNIGDPTYDHIAIFQNGSVNHNSLSQLSGAVQASPSSTNIEDGKDHLIRVQYIVASKTLNVWFDCSLRKSLQYDIQKNVFGGERFVFWGFTAATGGLVNVQTACLRDDILIQDTVAICKGNSEALNSRLSSDGTYRWWPSDFLSDTTVRKPICSSNIDQTYYVEFKDLCGQSLIDTVHARIDEPFELEAVKDSLLCDDDLYLVQLGNSYDSIAWSDKSGSSTRVFKDAGDYRVRTYRGACWAEDSMRLRTDLSPQLSLVGDSIFCEFDSTLIQVQSTPTSATFSWSDGSQENQRYFLESRLLQLESSNECGQASANYTLRKIVLPKDVINGDSIDCPQTQVELSFPYYPQLQYQWNTADTTNQISVDEGAYSLTISENMCSRTELFNVIGLDEPRIELQSNYLLCTKESLEIQIAQSSVSTLWSTGSKSPSLELIDLEGNFWVKTANFCGSDSFAFSVEKQFCDCRFYIPNAFTPNGDSKNEGFRAIPDCEKLLHYKLQIFSRWGELLFESEDPTEAWDGKYKGAALPQGVFVYLISYEGIIEGNPRSRLDKGTFHLLR